MLKGRFHCFDAHTCGNPVRVVTTGHPPLVGNSMSEKRQDFLNRFDWIRKGLMFEPRGHDMMSGSFIYPPCSDNADAAILFIETSGCLPMCGHGTIGTVTVAIEQGLIQPRTPGKLVLDVPAGQITVLYEQNANKVTQVTIFNVACYLAHQDAKIQVPELGELTIDVGYGGNFYAIVEPQTNFPGIEHWSASQILHYSPLVRAAADNALNCVHPEDEKVRGVTHVLWTGSATKANSTSANAVFYGDKAIDRSPCGTGTSARMAQRFAKGLLAAGEHFVHESYIGSQFIGKIEAVGEIHFANGETKPCIYPSITGSAHQFGENIISIDDDDPYAFGFTVI